MVKVLMGLLVTVGVGCASDLSPIRSWSGSCDVGDIHVKVETGFKTELDCQALARSIASDRAKFELAFGAVEVDDWHWHMVSDIDGYHSGMTYFGDKTVELTTTTVVVHELGHVTHGTGHPAPWWCSMGKYEESLYFYSNGNENGYLTECPP
jgi:hypothetical protein